MLSELTLGSKAIGLKQSRRAVLEGCARRAYVAKDAEKRLTDSFVALCEEHKVEVFLVPTMKALGDACKIEVGAAVAVLL